MTEPGELIRFRGFANELLFRYNTFTHGTGEQIAAWREMYGESDGKGGFQAIPWEPHEQSMKGAFTKAGLTLADRVATADGR